MSGWFDVILYSITVGTLLIQIYLFWLIVNKTPKRMQSFRFCLFMLMLNEFLFSISIGFVVDPDLLLFDAGFQGGIVNGVARFLGPEGGRYGFAVAMFFGAGVFCNQINCLMFRYTAIQQNHPNLNAKFNKWNSRICLGIFAYSICAVCAILGFNAMADVKEINYIITHPYHMNEEMAAKMASNGTVYIILSAGDGMREFGFFITGAYSMATILSIAFSGLIYQTINRNSAHFTARTFRLHLQLTALLIVQFCLPILFLMGPVGYAFASVIFYLPVPGYTGQISILLLSLYTMANSFVSLLFVTPYREHTLRICRLKKVAPQIKRLSLKTTQHPLGQSPLNKIVAMAEVQPVVDLEKNSD